MSSTKSQTPISHVRYQTNTDLKILCFSNENGTAQEVELWRTFIAPIFDFEIADPSQCRGKTTTAFLDDMALSTTHTTGGVLRRTEKTIAQGGLDNVSIVQYHSGNHTLETDRGVKLVEPGDFVVLDYTKPCTIEIETHSNSNLFFNRRKFAALVSDIDRVHGTVLKRGDVMNNILSAYLMNLTEQVSSLAISDSPRIAAATLSLFAAGLAGAFNQSSAIKSQQKGLSSTKLRDYIDENLANPNLNADLLVSVFPISRSSLYKMFEPVGGVQLYIRRRRLSRCFRSLVAPENHDQKVSEIAERWGFSNNATFNRLFRESFGVSPRDLRKSANLPMAERLTLEDEENMYIRYLHSISLISNSN